MGMFMGEENYIFEKLTPNTEANISVYDSAIEFVFNNSDVTNVAISGAYGAGKSSVIRTYENKHRDKKFMHISLAHFEPSDESEKNNSVDETRIEGKILNQLIHQIPVNKIPQTNFRIKKDIGKKDIISVTLLLCMLFGSATFISLSRKIQNWVNDLSDGRMKSTLEIATSNKAIVLAGILLMISVLIGIYNVVKIQKNKNLFHKVTVQGNTIEIFENKDDSYFDKYLNEVLYLFEQVGADVIVFEDMDRFNSNVIFERLREVNNLVNVQKYNKFKNCCQNKIIDIVSHKKISKYKPINKILCRIESQYKPLRFFYLLRDDVFITKDRTKFFDYIIPIVPVLDGSNSYDQFIRQLRKGTIYEKFDTVFLQRLSLYIDDMRVLKNVYNEFIVYMYRLNNTELNWNKMLAIIVYKNIFPRDFCDLQLGRGYVHELFEQKEKVSEETKTRLEQEKQDIQEKIDFINKENLDNVQEVRDAYKAKYSRLPKSRYNELTQAGEIEKKKLEKEESDRVDAIEGRNNGLLQQYELKVLKKEQEISVVKTKLLNELITRENSNSVFMIHSTNLIGVENEYKEIKGSDYFELLKFLISNGYIDETYNDYMTYFYEDSLSAHDKVFLRRITDKKGKDYDYRLKDAKKVISSPVLRYVDFYEEEILNYDLLKGLLENQENSKYQKYLTEMIRQLKDKKCIDFISKYYDSLQFNKTFIIKLNEQWNEFFHYVDLNKLLSAEQIKRFSVDSICLLDEQRVQNINIEGCLTNYISSQKDYLNIQNPNAEKMISQFCILGIKFKKIKFDTANTELFTGVYENNLYELTFENIELMLKIKYGENDSYSIKHRNYTVVQLIPNSPLAMYIATDLNKYAQEFIKNCNGIIEDSENDAIEFLNDQAITEEIQEKYVNALKTVISDISAIQNKKLWRNMLEKGIAKKTISNMMNYYIENGSDDKLITFINKCDDGMEYSKIENDFGADQAKEFFDAVAVNNNIETKKYQEILCDIGYSFDAYDANDISDDKIEVLIKNNIIEMNEEGLKYIRKYYKNYVTNYIQQNVGTYLNLITAANFNYDEALDVLKMNNVEDNEKIALLKLTVNSISVVGQKYSNSLVTYILENNFHEDDEKELYQNFSKYDEDIQLAIYKVAESRIDNIIKNTSVILDDKLLSELLTKNKCSMSDKIQLWAKALPIMDEETCKKHFDELGFSELKGIFTKRNNLTKRYESNSYVRDILIELKKNTWIYDYHKKGDDESYVVIKNPTKRKKHYDNK